MNDKVDLFVDFYLYFTTLLTAELFGLMVFRILSRGVTFRYFTFPRLPYTA